MKLIKYPRTRHVEGSRLQAGDIADDLTFAEIGNAPLVVEEKLDGTNTALAVSQTSKRGTTTFMELTRIHWVDKQLLGR